MERGSYNAALCVALCKNRARMAKSYNSEEKPESRNVTSSRVIFFFF